MSWLTHILFSPGLMLRLMDLSLFLEGEGEIRNTNGALANSRLNSLGDFSLSPYFNQSNSSRLNDLLTRMKECLVEGY